MSNGRYIAIIVVIGIILIIGAVMLGKSDDGQININQAINSANQANIEAGITGETVNTTPANLRNLPNGGLVPKDIVERPPSPEETAEEESSTSTDNTEVEETEDTDGNTGEIEPLEEDIPTETSE
jgi:hypothetical protein